MRLVRLLYEININVGDQNRPTSKHVIGADDLASFAKEHGYYPSYLSICECEHIYNPESYGDCPNCDPEGERSVSSTPLYTSPYHAKMHNPDWLKTPAQIGAFLMNPKNGISM